MAVVFPCGTVACGLVRGVVLAAAGGFRAAVKDNGGTFVSGLVTGGFTAGAAEVVEVDGGSAMRAAAKAFSAFVFRTRFFFSGGPVISGAGRADNGPAGGVFFGFAIVVAPPRFCSERSQTV